MAATRLQHRKIHRTPTLIGEPYIGYPSTTVTQLYQLWSQNTDNENNGKISLTLI